MSSRKPRPPAFRPKTKVSPLLNTLQALEIENLSSNGKGVGRHQGKVVFVSNALPGETVEAKITRVKKDFMEAELVKVIAASEYRVVPQCQYFGRCGGCQLQHLEYAQQIHYKKQQVLKTFRHQGGIELANLDVATGRPYGYRNRVRLHQHKKTKLVGFKQAASNQLQAIDQCPVLVDEINQWLLNRDIQEAGTQDTISLFATQGECHTSNETINMTLMDKQVYLSNKVFFQSNLELLPEMIQYVLDNTHNGVVMDLFAGIGLFSVFLQDHCDKVIAVEMNQQCQDLAKLHLKDNVERYYAPVENWIESNPTTELDTVIVDPPREGIDAKALNHINQLNCKRLIYVSCNPVTQARDLKVLNQHYKIKDARLFDMFPQTHHIENTVVLDRK